MVRVDRLYLGPMFAPDQLGSEILNAIEMKLGSELLPAPVKSLVWGASVCMLMVLGPTNNTTEAKDDQENTNRKTRVDNSNPYQKMEE
jgi:hypothetical protein